MKKLRGVVTADDLVNRTFHRLSPNELWVTDITEHRTRKGKVFCCCVMDTLSRKIVGRSIDTVQNSDLIVNALDMAVKNQQFIPGGVVHAGHDLQLPSGVFTNKIREVGLMSSFGSIGDGLDNGMMESFWSQVQIELLDRQPRST